MQLHDGTILMHGAAPYDPKKAHEYYMRVRKLKGRQKAGAEAVATGFTKKAQVDPHSKNKAAWDAFLNTLPMVVEGADLKTANDFVMSLRGKSDAQLAEAAKNMKDDPGFKNADIKKKTIEALLKNRTRVRTADPSHLTPQQRTEQAVAARRDVISLRKNLSQLNSEIKKSKDPKNVDALKKRIDDAQKRLTAAVARQKALATAT